MNNRWEKFKAFAKEISESFAEGIASAKESDRQARMRQAEEQEKQARRMQAAELAEEFFQLLRNENFGAVNLAEIHRGYDIDVVPLRPYKGRYMFSLDLKKKNPSIEDPRDTKEMEAYLTNCMRRHFRELQKSYPPNELGMRFFLVPHISRIIYRTENRTQVRFVFLL